MSVKILNTGLPAETETESETQASYYYHLFPASWGAAETETCYCTAFLYSSCDFSGTAVMTNYETGETPSWLDVSQTNVSSLRVMGAGGSCNFNLQIDGEVTTTTYLGGWYDDCWQNYTLPWGEHPQPLMNGTIQAIQLGCTAETETATTW